ncbi:MAG: hypothetical protein KAS32_26295 [Candidatus Peribacteraceae bacterium]|nr:hypothetical protein [Candidatus Peribacteraceae bacterium]
MEAAKIYQEQLNELLGDEKEEVTSFHEYATTFATLTNPLLGVGVALFGREVCGAVEEALDDIPVLKNVLRFF